MVIDVERLEGEVIPFCGAGGSCEAMKTGLLLAGLKDQLQPKSPPRRIYYPLCCGSGSLEFNSMHGAHET